MSPPENGRINSKPTPTNKRQPNDAKKVGNTSLNFNIDTKSTGGVLVSNKQVNGKKGAMPEATTITVTDEMVPHHQFPGSHVPQQYVILDSSGLQAPHQVLAMARGELLLSCLDIRCIVCWFYQLLTCFIFI